MAYVDGFVIPVPRKKVALYRKIASEAGRIWRKHGAVEYLECMGDAVKPMKGFLSYARAVKLKKGEVVWYSYIRYKSKAQRDAVNKKIMKDKRILEMMEELGETFDMKRMLYGGFKVVVDA